MRDASEILVAGGVSDVRFVPSCRLPYVSFRSYHSGNITLLGAVLLD